jgi:hypothetical protein
MKRLRHNRAQREREIDSNLDRAFDRLHRDSGTPLTDLQEARESLQQVEGQMAALPEYDQTEWSCPNGCETPKPAWWPAPPGGKTPPCGNCDAPLERVKL